MLELSSTPHNFLFSFLLSVVIVNSAYYGTTFRIANNNLENDGILIEAECKYDNRYHLLHVPNCINHAKKVPNILLLRLV